MIREYVSGLYDRLIESYRERRERNKDWIPLSDLMRLVPAVRQSELESSCCEYRVENHED